MFKRNFPRFNVFDYKSRYIEKVLKDDIDPWLQDKCNIMVSDKVLFSFFDIQKDICEKYYQLKKGMEMDMEIYELEDDKEEE